MKQKGLDNYLKSFLEQESLFKNKKVFQSNFIPPELLHRDDQQEQIAGILAPGPRICFFPSVSMPRAMRIV